MGGAGTTQDANGVSREGSASGSTEHDRVWRQVDGSIARAQQIKELVVLGGSVLSLLSWLGGLLWGPLGRGWNETWNLAEETRKVALPHVGELAVFEAIFISMMWLFLARLPAGAIPGPASLDPAVRQAHRFRVRYEALLGAWILLYVVLAGAHHFAPDVMSPLHELSHLLLTVTNFVSAVCLTLAYQALSERPRRSDSVREMGLAEKGAITAGVTFVLAAAFFFFDSSDGVLKQHVHPDQGWKLFGFASGLYSAVALGLFASRIFSAGLGGVLVAAGLQMYAAIQPLFGCFLDSPLIEFVAIAFAIPLKAIMFWVISRAIGDGSLTALLSDHPPSTHAPV